MTQAKVPGEQRYSVQEEMEISPLSSTRSALAGAMLAFALACCSDPGDVRDNETSTVWSEAGQGRSPSGLVDANSFQGLADSSALPSDAPRASGIDAGRATGAGAVNDAGATRDAANPTGPDATAADGSPRADASGSDAGLVDEPAEDCQVPTLSAPSQLAPQPKHPDPFKMLDGSRITQKDQWRCRRAEILAQVLEYESGPKPSVAPEAVGAKWSGNTLSITVSNAGKSVQFALNINRPANAGSDPIPLLIAFTFMTLDSSVFTQNGVATTTFSHDALGAQSGGGSRGTGLFYELYGKDHPASSIVAWAWGVSRILDALEKTPEAKIDPKRVAVTGCSRYGKGALLAGALDERVALTIPQESGAGGSASWRVSQAQSAMGVNVQTLSNAAGEQPWFRANFGQAFGGSNVTKLPFDHHMVMGLVAPRPLLVIDNAIDWLGIDSSFTAGSIAHTIWEALGRGDHMGYSQSSAHTHCQFPSQQRAILDAYVKKFLVGSGDGDTRVLRAESAKADLTTWMDWAAPVLQ